MTYTKFMEEQRKEYADLYARYRMIRDNLPKRKDYRSKTDWIGAYYTAAVSMLNAFDYNGFIKRITNVTELTPIDFAYARLFNRIRNIPEMKEYVFIQNNGYIRESELTYRIVGFKLIMGYADYKVGNIILVYPDRRYRRTIYLDISYITPCDYDINALKIIPDPKNYKLKTREELLMEDSKYFKQIEKEGY